MDEQQFLEIKDVSHIDILDENLYSYENAIFTLTPAMQRRTSDNLLRKVQQFIDSVPAIQKAVDNMKSKIEYIPRFELFSDEIKKFMHEGKVEVIPCKKVLDAFYFQIRSTVTGLIVNGKEYGKNIKIKDIAVSTKIIPTDIIGAMQCLSNQNQFNQINNGLIEISKTCQFNFEKIIKGNVMTGLLNLLAVEVLSYRHLSYQTKFYNVKCFYKLSVMLILLVQSSHFKLNPISLCFLAINSLTPKKWKRWSVT